MSVVTARHTAPAVTAHSRLSCLAFPVHPLDTLHGASAKHCAGQAVRACPAPVLHHRQQRRQPLVVAQALHGVSQASQTALGWHSNFSSNFALGPVLGRGSFGTVHEATHKVTGASYAVKVLQKTGRPVGPGHLDAIKQEVASWVQAQGSKFVAKLEGLYEDDENAYIVSELCGGGDLKSLLEANGCFSEPDTAAIMRGVLDMLAECHRRNICYGDVKPANFLLGSAADSTDDGLQVPTLTVRAVDFGCSKVVAKGASLSQQSGTPLYMAPEMALQRFGPAVDVWAAGVMMYQMLTGKLPFWANKTMSDVSRLMPYEIMAAVRTHEVHYDRKTWAQLTPEARGLVEQMLERNPAQRISAEAALAHPWFKRLLGYRPVPSGSPGNNVVGFARQGSSPVRDVEVAIGSDSEGECSSPCPCGKAAAPSLARSHSAVLDDLLAMVSPSQHSSSPGVPVGSGSR